MKRNDLYIKLEKCKWKVRKIWFLGVVIRPDGVETEKEKVKIVLDWMVPKLVKEMQKFLGLANYYKQFLKDFAKIARLLYELTRKNKNRSKR